METIHGLAELEAIIGKEIGPTDWFTVDQARVNGFADDTEHHQWIHVDLERALAGPFGAPVAHGFLTLSLIPYLAQSSRRAAQPESEPSGMRPMSSPSASGVSVSTSSPRPGPGR